MSRIPAGKANINRPGRGATIASRDADACIHFKKRYCTDRTKTFTLIALRRNITFILLFSCALLSAATQAIDTGEVPQKLHTPFGLYLTPNEAYNMKADEGDQVLLVDIRSRAELKYVGSSNLVDANIPYRFIHEDLAWSDKSQTFRTQPNGHLIEDFEKLLHIKNKDKTTAIILMCQSGHRAVKVAKRLHKAGFKQIYTQYQGFEGIKARQGIFKGQRVINGWKNAGLPWSYKLNKHAMYFNFDSTLNQGTD
jgi:rhodanese-related sulfurtransferase